MSPARVPPFRGLLLVSALATGAFAAPAPAAPPPAYFLGPLPYLKFEGSVYSYLWDHPHGMENFESGKVSTPGLSISPGQVVCKTLYVDSVDEDDGAIDGYGRGGCSWYVNGPTVTVSFDKETLGYYPTNVAIVWTDIGSGTPRDGFGYITLKVFNEEGVKVGEHRYEQEVGDGQRTGETDEDRWVAAGYYGGIGALSMTIETSSDWELDHVHWFFQCVADCNADKKLTVNDFVCFQALWRDRDPYGDFNEDKKFDINDFISFHDAFRHGCYFE